jgi:hypothetical protein
MNSSGCSECVEVDGDKKVCNQHTNKNPNSASAQLLTDNMAGM